MRKLSLWMLMLLILVVVIGSIYYRQKDKNSNNTTNQNQETSANVLIVQNISKEYPLTQAYGSKPDVLYVWNPDQQQAVARIATADKTPSLNAVDYVYSGDKIFYYDYQARNIKWLDYGGTVHTLAFAAPADSKTNGLAFVVSPDSKQIAWVDTTFDSAKSANNLYVANLDGSNQHLIYSKTLSSAQVIRPYRWTDKIYFATYPEGIGGYILFYGPNNLSSIDPAQNLNAVNATPTPTISPSPAPTNTGNPTGTASTNGNIPTPKIDTVWTLTETGGGYLQDISADNKKIIYIHGQASQQILTVKDLTGATDIQNFNVARDPGFTSAGNAYFSPDGKNIVFNEAANNPEAEHYQTVVINLETSSRKMIWENPNEEFGVVRWAGNNKIELIGNNTVYFINRDGSGFERAKLPQPDGWKLYTNDQYGFSVQYPDGFTQFGNKSSNSVLGDAQNPVPGIFVGPLVFVIADTPQLRDKASTYINSYYSTANKPLAPNGFGCTTTDIQNQQKIFYVYCTGEGGPATYALIKSDKYDIFVDGYSNGFGGSEDNTTLRNLGQEQIQRIISTFELKK